MLLGARRIGVPLLVGSCGTGGADAQVDLVRDIVLEIAREEKLSFRLATIRSEQQKPYLLQRLEHLIILLPEVFWRRVERPVHPHVDAQPRDADAVRCFQQPGHPLFRRPPGHSRQV